MTMMKREPDSIWNRVREDRDVDDLIFADCEWRASER